MSTGCCHTSLPSLINWLLVADVFGALSGYPLLLLHTPLFFFPFFFGNCHFNHFFVKCEFTNTGTVITAAIQYTSFVFLVLPVSFSPLCTSKNVADLLKKKKIQHFFLFHYFFSHLCVVLFWWKMKCRIREIFLLFGGGGVCAQGNGQTWGGGDEVR